MELTIGRVQCAGRHKQATAVDMSQMNILLAWYTSWLMLAYLDLLRKRNAYLSVEKRNYSVQYRKFPTHHDMCNSSTEKKKCLHCMAWLIQFETSLQLKTWTLHPLCNSVSCDLKTTNIIKTLLQAIQYPLDPLL